MAATFGAGIYGCGGSSSASFKDGGLSDASGNEGGTGNDASSSGSSSGSEGGAASLRGHVAYMDNPGGQSFTNIVYYAPLDGSAAPRPLTPSSGVANTMRFAADGASLYYAHQTASGFEVRNVRVDGSNDRLVYGGCTQFCYALGNDPTGRVFIFLATMGVQGTLSTIAGDAGAPVLAPWGGDPGCTVDANLNAAGDVIVLTTGATTTGCQSDKLFVGSPSATMGLVGNPLMVQVMQGSEHVQEAGGHVFLRGWPAGVDAGPTIHVLSMAGDGTGVVDLNVGDDAQEFVVSSDASFVLVSHVTPPTDASALSSYSIVAHHGTTRTPIPGLGAILSQEIVTLAWTPH
jgi:hypothetical protein